MSTRFKAISVMVALATVCLPFAFGQHTEPPDPTPPTFTAAYLLPSSSLTLEGTWESLWTLEIVEEKRAEIVSPDRFTVPADTIGDLLDGATEVPIAQIPSDCRLCLKWRAEDEDTWFTSGYRDKSVLKGKDGAECGCVMRGESPDAGDVKVAADVRLVYMVYEIPGSMDVTRTGDGELRLYRDESKMELACSNPIHEGKHAILAAVSEIGDVYFFLVTK